MGEFRDRVVAPGRRVMLIDTHAHLDYPEFTEDFSGILSRSHAAGVTAFICIATGLASSERGIQLAEKYPEISAAIGVHPNNVEEEPDEFAETLRALGTRKGVAAIGETGLDYFRMTDDEAAGTNKERQAAFFRKQLDLAVKLGLNVVVHQRAAWDDTVAILTPYSGKLRAVFHCFGESLERAEEVIALGHLVSFTGIATFKNGENVREVARRLAPGQFMVETDCPYLAPVPFRGKRCEPAHTLQVAEVLATVRGETLAEFSNHTTATAREFFNLN